MMRVMGNVACRK